MALAPQYAYRPDIDGLRAIAVLLVIAFHAFPQNITGGFIGVDIFFVISGYLISGVILAEYESGKFRFSSFYARRMIRLAPSLIITLLLVGAIGWHILTKDEFTTLGRHIFGGSLFFDNILYFQEAGYFDASGDQKPLLHLWSLGIEEQFYLIWPTVLLWVCRKRWSLFFVALLTSIFYAICIFQTSHNAAAAFYLLPSRFWEFLIGAIVSIMEFNRKQKGPLLETTQVPKKAIALPDFLSLAAMLGLFLSIATIDKNISFPGSIAALPTISSALLIASKNSWLNTRILSSRPLIAIGLISYPLYLIHWPALFWMRRNGDQNLSVEAFLWFLLGCALFSSALYVGVERPLRKFGNGIQIRLALGLFLTLIATALLGSLANNSYIGPKLAAQEEKITPALRDWASPIGGLKGSELVVNSIHGNLGNFAIFIGDSHVEQYWPRLEKIVKNAPNDNLNVLLAGWGGCPPLPNTREVKSDRPCEIFTRKAFDLARRPDIEVVVLGAQWEGYFLGVLGRELSHKPTLASTTGGSIKVIDPGKEEFDAAFDRLETEIKLLRGLGKKVFIVLSSPSAKANNPMEMLIQLKRTGRLNDDDFKIKRDEFEKFSAPVIRKLRLIANRTDSLIIDPLDFVCKNNVCPAIVADKPIYRDDDHLRPFFVRDHASFIDKTISAH